LRVTSKGTSTELNNEVLRVMRLLPHFEPAVSKGKKVSYKMWGEDFYFQLKPCTKKEFYPIEITPTDCGLPSFSPDSTGVYTFTEKMPEYPGGEAELMSFISRNKYHFKPEDDNPPQGTVIIQFIVKETGEISNIKLIRSIDKDLDNDAIRVVKMLAKWKPGVHDGRKVNVYYILPVSYRLED